MELATTKLIPVYASLVALLTVAGCSESDKSTSPDNSSETSKVVDTIYELGKCTDKLEGTARLVSDEDVYYICTDNEWVKAIEEKSSSSSADQKNSSEKEMSSSSDDIEDSGESSSETSESSSSVTESSSSVKSSSSSKVESSSSSKVESSSSSKVESSSSSKVESSSSSKVESSCSSVEEPGSSSFEAAVVKPSGTYDCEQYKCVATTYLNPNIEYGEILDARDNQVYKTTKIGDRVWMAQNLNYSDSIQSPALLKNSWCSGGLRSNCARGGRLYSWPGAMNMPKDSCGYGSLCNLSTAAESSSMKWQGVCPVGWHIANREDWGALKDSVGDAWHKLTALPLDMWNVQITNGIPPMSDVDKWGFSAINAFIRYTPETDGGTRNTHWWLPTEHDKWIASNAALETARATQYVFMVTSDSKSYGLYVRCVLD